MAKKSNLASKIGSWSFVAGFAIAAIISVFSAASPPAWAIWVVAVLGLLVGFLNVADREVHLFLIASIAFLLSFQALGSVLSSLALGWGAVSTFFNLMSVFVAPAAAIVAFRELYEMARD